MSRLINILILAIAFPLSAISQKAAIKANLLYGATTLTPNLGLEVGLGKHTTIDLSGGYNPWNRTAGKNDNKKLVHWLVQPEFRYWLCQRFNGHFFGVHALGGQYNIAGHKLLGMVSADYRYEGYMVGGGLTYGYQFVLGRNWNLEASIGIGYARLHYDKYNCPTCSALLERGVNKNYFGPTKASISIIFTIR
ncbi:MAG: DUF3575 domain-containing protein [Mucinivorans sp.]